MPVENITQNMNEEGHSGLWYSVIDGMDCYRVRIDGENSFHVEDQDGELIEDDEKAKEVVDELRGYLA